MVNICGLYIFLIINTDYLPFFQAIEETEVEVVLERTDGSLGFNIMGGSEVLLNVSFSETFNTFFVFMKVAPSVFLYTKQTSYFSKNAVRVTHKESSPLHLCDLKMSPVVKLFCRSKQNSPARFITLRPH